MFSRQGSNVAHEIVYILENVCSLESHVNSPIVIICNRLDCFVDALTENTEETIEKVCEIFKLKYKRKEGLNASQIAMDLVTLIIKNKMNVVKVKKERMKLRERIWELTKENIEMEKKKWLKKETNLLITN